ncbi:hypothetical protein HQ520_16995, partial [bacterium]|nr:hypothetical protein [bacterium]
KGFWDIETPNMSKQAAPLAVISAAILTRDEGFYARRALPTIAFTLSRTRSDIIRGGVNRLGVPVHQQLNVPTLFYDANHWQGVDALLNALNPWLEEFIFPQGPEAESIRGEAWSTHFAQWRYRPDPELLKQVTEEADAFVRTNFLERHEQPIPFSTFYNFNYTPYWYDLVGLYEVTGKKEYLEVAELGAFCNTAGQWSHPPIPNGEFIVNPGSRMPLTSVDNDRHKGPIPFRVGFPPGPDAFPEKRVPAWQVSPNGLSLENPSTYFNARRDTCMNIMMSNFAPHQLRVYRHTGREILRTYARNAVIGRFANYPGYYLPDFTDLPHQPRYPYEGPDITEFYYHHIPPHLAFALDFLVEQAIVRSNGRISFPWVKQRGYVWFNNRVYGLKPGSIYGEDGAVLWLDRRLYDPRTKDVDWLAASSGDRFWLILMNQTEEALGVPVKVDAGLTGVRMDAACRIYEGGTAEPREEMRVPERIAVPAKGVVAISIPTEPREGWPSVPPLKKGHVLEKLGAPWGDLHAFRIRSPFGSDGLYVVLVNEPVEGGEVRFRLSGPSGQKEVVTGEYPYEWIVYPLPLDQPIRCDVEVRRPGAAAVRGVVEFGQE